MSIWESYGLRGSPFFQDELSSNPASEHPVDKLLVGRDQELRLLERQVVGERHSRSIVEGQPGIGKTSFVNRFKAGCARAGMLIHEDPIRIESTMAARDLVAEVLRVILRVRNAALGVQSLWSTTAGKAFRSREDKTAAAFWDQAARIVEGADTMSGGISGGTSFAQLGVQVDRGRIAPDVPIGSLYHVLDEALERLRKEAGASVLLHVNNLENLTEAGKAEHAAVLIRDLRDYFMIPGAHWLFVGTTGVTRDVFRRFDQVGGIMPLPLTLKPLSPDEVGSLLTLRYEHLKRRTRYVAPIAAADASELYSRYFGDLRNFLRLLSDAASRLLGVRGIQPMTAEQVMGTMAPVYAAKLEEDLSPALFAHLRRAIGDEKKPDYEFRVSELTRRAGISQPVATRAMNRLLAKRIVTESRTEGRSTYYRLTGETCVALGLGVPPAGS
jgi:DNA-binding transcriptional ArsR family regulator